MALKTGYALQMEKIRLGIAACLLGQEVRWNKGHKLDRYLRDDLGAFVDWVPVCPEVGCGMGLPRETVRLAGDPENPRLVGTKSGQDWTGRMRAWGRERIEALRAEGICGYVFKHGSPSSGMRGIKVWQKNGQPLYSGTGIWARMVMDAFPLLPFEDDGRLNDAVIRENFIVRVFTLKRWRDMLDAGPARGALVDFHTRHKMLIRSHDEVTYREMGGLVARVAEDGLQEVLDRYFALLSRALSRKSTVKKHVNVLTHCVGHFKKLLTSDEKQELLEVIDQYRLGLTPLIVPVTLMNHYVRKYREPYLEKQWYLHPHPMELRLRNHV
ncbi:YbgA family protein [Desulfocurvus sp. DL9XJH121]